MSLSPQGPNVFIDMDGVLVDYASSKNLLPCMPHEEFHKVPEIFRRMLPMPGALDAIARLEELNCNVWIATLPPPHAPEVYTDKALWVQQWVPRLLPKLILTPDKSLLGTYADFLIDDRPHAANAFDFPGTLIHFKPGERDVARYWASLVESIALNRDW